MGSLCHFISYQVGLCKPIKVILVSHITLRSRLTKGELDLEIRLAWEVFLIT